MIDGDDGDGAGELVMTLMIKIVTQATNYDDVRVHDVGNIDNIDDTDIDHGKSTQETRGEVQGLQLLQTGGRGQLSLPDIFRFAFKD